MIIKSYDNKLYFEGLKKKRFKNITFIPYKMALDNVKDVNIHLSNECLMNYPSQYDSAYKQYEFLNCCISLNDYHNRHLIKYYNGRFKGIYVNHYSGIKGVALYKTSIDDFSRNNLCRSSLHICSKDRLGIECQLYAISLRKCRMWVDKYPIYKRGLLLLYFHLIKTNTPLPIDCVSVISEYLKPKNRTHYELFWDTYK